MQKSPRTNKDLLAEREQHVPRGPFNVTPLFAAGAEGAKVWDVEGKEYIDFAGGIGVVNAGHCPPSVVEAIRDQAGKFLHTCFHMMMYEPYVALAKRLNALAPGAFPKKTMFANSGAEAVENGVKVARAHTKRPAVICFEDAFHGRTLLALSLTSKIDPYKLGFAPFAPEVYRLPYAYCYRCPIGLTYPSCNVACADLVEEAFVNKVQGESVAALVVEPVLGEGGFVVPPPEYLPKLKAICEKYGIVFVADEVQTAFGRTGRLFAVEHWNVAPDILLTAKSLAAGLPLSAITGRAEVMDAPGVGGLGGTFGGNPLSCRAALAVLDLMERERLPDKAAAIGEVVQRRFREWQKRYEIVGDVRGLGAMVALELVTDREKKTPAKAETKLVVKKCYEKGLLTIGAGTHNNVIRTLMPLVIGEAEVRRGLDILEEALSEVAA